LYVIVAVPRYGRLKRLSCFARAAPVCKNRCLIRRVFIAKDRSAVFLAPVRAACGALAQGRLNVAQPNPRRRKIKIAYVSV